MSKSETVDLVVDHELQGVTPKMLDWWWNHIDTTERYKLWHPKDHKSFGWEVSPKKGHVGAIHLVLEEIGGNPITLRIRREDPSSCLYLQPTATSSCLVSLAKTTTPSVELYMNMRQCSTERECAQHFDYLQGSLKGLWKACAKIVRKRWRICPSFFQNCTRMRISN